MHNEQPNTNRMTDYISLCQQINALVEQRKPIKDKVLFDFTNSTFRIFRNPEQLEEAPNEFKQLWAAISDYWDTYSATEADMELGNSYTQIRQTIRFTAMGDEPILVPQRILFNKRKIARLALRFRPYQRILKSILQFPGISGTVLSIALQMSLSEATKLLSIMADSKLLKAYPLGKANYYVVTKLGAKVYGEITRRADEP